MIFFQDVNGAWKVDDMILPPGKFALKEISPGVVELREHVTGRNFLGPVRVTELQRSDDSTYGTMEEFLTDNANFFR